MFENLNDFYKNINSQRGEDGIIEEICKRLGLTKGYCVEFGAGDGISLSNTKNLIDKGWLALMIESQPSLFKKCENLYKDNSRVMCLNTVVDCEENSLDNLIDTHFILPNIVSIDIDGNDFEIFSSIKDFYPDLIIVESNPYREPLDPTYHGAVHDLQESLYVFSKEKFEDYKIICYTQNIFFINREHADLFDPPDLMDMFINGFVRSYHLETDPQEKYRIFNRIKDQFGLDNTWLEVIIEEHCND